MKLFFFLISGLGCGGFCRDVLHTVFFLLFLFWKTFTHHRLAHLQTVALLHVCVLLYALLKISVQEPM